MSFATAAPALYLMAPNQMPLEIVVRSLRHASGAEIVVPEGGIVVFVGPNNAGKSLSLRELHMHVTTPNPGEPFRSITSIDTRKTGDLADLDDWLRATCKVGRQGGAEAFFRYGNQVQTNPANSWWPNGPPFYQLGSFFSLYLGAGQAASAAIQSQSYNTMTETPTQPLQYLFADGALERRLAEVVARAFGTGVVLNRFGGSQMTLHVGSPPDPFQTSGPPPVEYMQAMANMPLMQNQSDGVRSFVGLVLNVMAAPFQLILLDEPDTFLHPPQAELMGRLLGELKARNTQLFIATHDANLLRGLLNTSGIPLTIVRLDRRADVPKFAQLAPAALQVLWQDPILRYSNLLEGLFHMGTIICESDADCRFYSSVMDVLSAERNAAHNLLFSHVGGKHRMRTAVAALRAVAVPVAAIADFDILQDENVVRPLFEALGGDWTNCARDWTILSSAMSNLGQAPSTEHVRDEVTKYLAGVSTPRLERRDEERVRQLTRTETGWEVAKKGGISVVPGGAPMSAAQRLLSKLSESGLFVVPVGELERFVPEVSGKGPAWVTEVHAQHLHEHPTLSARSFMDSVWRFTSL